jgi:hypothetical protein
MGPRRSRTEGPRETPPTRPPPSGSPPMRRRPAHGHAAAHPAHGGCDAPGRADRAVPRDGAREPAAAPIVQPLGHEVVSTAPAGLVAAHVAPVPSLTSSAAMPTRHVQRRAAAPSAGSADAWSEPGVAPDAASSSVTSVDPEPAPVRHVAPVAASQTVTPPVRPLTVAPPVAPARAPVAQRSTASSAATPAGSPAPVSAELPLAARGTPPARSGSRWSETPTSPAAGLGAPISSAPISSAPIRARRDWDARIGVLVDPGARSCPVGARRPAERRRARRRRRAIRADGPGWAPRSHRCHPRRRGRRCPACPWSSAPYQPRRSRGRSGLRARCPRVPWGSRCFRALPACLL